MKILYRLSDGSNRKDKLPHADKLYCLRNCVSVFGREPIVLFADNCRAETLGLLRAEGFEPHQIALGNARSWRYAVEFAIANYSEEETVYLLEDDYLHLPPAPKVLAEGMTIGDYVSLYDHPDKYIDVANGGMNPFVNDGSEATRVFLTSSCHWKRTNSTTMTFAATVGTLKEDKAIWWKFTSTRIPEDFKAFQRLCGIGRWTNRWFGKRRRVVTPLPGVATHVETAWLGPLVDWTQV